MDGNDRSQRQMATNEKLTVVTGAPKGDRRRDSKNICNGLNLLTVSCRYQHFSRRRSALGTGEHVSCGPIVTCRFRGRDPSGRGLTSG
jgi:hypothetical protein